MQIKKLWEKHNLTVRGICWGLESMTAEFFNGISAHEICYEKKKIKRKTQNKWPSINRTDERKLEMWGTNQAHEICI